MGVRGVGVHEEDGIAQAGMHLQMPIEPLILYGHKSS